MHLVIGKLRLNAQIKHAVVNGVIVDLLLIFVRKALDVFLIVVMVIYLLENHQISKELHIG